MTLRSRFRTSSKCGSRVGPLKKEKDSPAKPPRRRSLTESLHNLAKHAFGRRDDSGSHKISGQNAEVRGGKRKSSTTTSTSSTGNMPPLPSSEDMTSSPVGKVNKEEACEQKNAPWLSLPETPSPLPPSDLLATSSPLPKVRAKIGREQQRRPSRIPTPTKLPLGALDFSKTSRSHGLGVMSLSPSQRTRGSSNTKGKESVPARISNMDTDSAMQKFQKCQENLKEGINRKDTKTATSSPAKNPQTARRTSRLPRTSGRYTPVTSPEKRTASTRMSLPVSKSLSTGLSSVHPSRRESLLPASMYADSTRKPSATTTRLLYGNRRESAVQKSSITSPNNNISGRVAMSTRRKESNVRASSIPQRQLLQPLGPPMPRSQTFDSLVQSRRARPIPSAKEKMGRMPCMSDISDRTALEQTLNDSRESDEYAEIVDVLKATRLSKAGDENEEMRSLKIPDMTETTAYDAVSYEEESTVVDELNKEVEGEEKSDKMVSKS